MKREDIQAFLARDWQLVEAQKALYWVDRKRNLTPFESLELGEELRQHARRLRPDWPSEEERREDLEVHRRVSESLRRVR